jgi:glucose 1-dehydrogenase
MPQPLQGQKALVTGASSGLGAGIALAEAGAAVAVNYSSSPEGAQRTVDKIAVLGVEAMAIRANVATEDDAQAMFQQISKRWGAIDILVNNSGLQRDAAVTDMPLEQWNTVLGVNLIGMFLLPGLA